MHVGKKVGLFFLIATPFGCTGQIHWEHSSNNAETTLLDIRECRAIATEETGITHSSRTMGGRLETGNSVSSTLDTNRLRSREERIKCMENRGYVRSEIQDR